MHLKRKNVPVVMETPGFEIELTEDEAVQLTGSLLMVESRLLGLPDPVKQLLDLLSVRNQGPADAD